MSDHLFYALAEEHKQRTRHDVFKQGPMDTTHISCDVCLHLLAELRDRQNTEREWHEQQREANPNE
jgi:hypothetical protein